MWVSVSFPEVLPAGKLPQGGRQIVKMSRSPPEDHVPVIHVSTIQSNVFLIDYRIKVDPVAAVVGCGSPIYILSNDVFKCIGLKGSLGKVESKVVGAEGSQLDIVGTVKGDMAFKGINTKQLFYICNNLKQRALLGVNF